MVVCRDSMYRRPSVGSVQRAVDPRSGTLHREGMSDTGMARSFISRALVALNALLIGVLAAAPVIASTASPPPVRTSWDGIIVGACR